MGDNSIISHWILGHYLVLVYCFEEYAYLAKADKLEEIALSRNLSKEVPFRYQSLQFVLLFDLWNLPIAEPKYLPLLLPCLLNSNLWLEDQIILFGFQDKVLLIDIFSDFHQDHSTLFIQLLVGQVSIVNCP